MDFPHLRWLHCADKKVASTHSATSSKPRQFTLPVQKRRLQCGNFSGLTFSYNGKVCSSTQAYKQINNLVKGIIHLELAHSKK